MAVRISVERGSSMIAALAEVIGCSSAEIDALFVRVAAVVSGLSPARFTSNGPQRMNHMRDVFLWRENMVGEAFDRAGRWLIEREAKYGGYVSGVARNVVSPSDARTSSELATGGMTGGDRMSPTHHHYAPHYARYLAPFVQNKRPVVVEVGILKGSGLAIWSDLFPKGRVIGLDIDIGHTKGNWSSLVALGAFCANNVELHAFDQLIDEQSRVAEILGGDSIDILIDDGLHNNVAALRTAKVFAPFLSSNFAYFIEDNRGVQNVIRNEFPRFKTRAFGELTVVRPRRFNWLLGS